MPPLLFVHGAWHGAWVWEERWAPALRARGWRVETLDLIGHGSRRTGGSQGPPLTTPLSRYERDIAAAVARLPADPVVVGHSMGGFVVGRVAARTQVAAAVFVGAVPRWGGSGVAGRLLVRRPLDTLGLAAGDPPDHRRFLLGDQLDDRLAQLYLGRLQREAVVAQVQTSLPRIPRRLSCPVLVMGGGEDRLVDPRSQIRAARWYGTRAHLFRDMGHDLMWDAGWRAPLTTMAGWLDERWA